MKLGYARVSTNSQDHQLQVDALNAAGVDEIITDTISGSSKKREGLDRLLDKAREGDTIVVWRLDRLGRSLSHLIQLVEQLKARGIGFKSLQEEINTDTANGMFFFHM
ncbi:MAG: recombinase family protein, partial [Shewanella oncorhynchi]